MNIKDKLRQIESAGRPRTRRPVTSVAQNDLARLLGGEVVRNALGSFIRVRHEIPLASRHGTIPMTGTPHIAGGTLAIVAKQRVSSNFSLPRALFIDTETTGLSGGTGTYVFLTGAGYLEADVLIIEQLFLARLADEPALLSHLATLAANRTGILSYNGKSFDVPLLTTRYIRHRMPPAFEVLEHLDLLHAARRLWKQDYGDCSLGTIETALLGFVRQDDIPGAEIPEIYMNFIRYGETARLAAVLLHNKLDIISLLALTAVLARIVEDPAASLARPPEASRLARLFETAKALPQAAALYDELAAREAPSGSERMNHLLGTARTLKKMGTAEKAVTYWLEATAFGAEGLEAFVELAKHYEHRAKDPAQALEFTERALQLVETKLQLQPADAFVRSKQQLEHRLARLQRKIHCARQ